MIQEATLGPAPVRRSEQPDVVAFVRQVRSDADADVVRWCVAPMLLPAFDPSSGGRAGLRLEGPRMLSALLPLRRGLDFRLVGPVLCASHGGNPRRTLAAIEAALPGGSDPRMATPRSAPTGAVVRWTRAARRFRADFLAAVRASPFTVDDGVVAQVTSAAARSLARAEGVLATHHPAVVVVATQHAVDVRAVLALSAQQGLPSVYFPHAPVESTPKYADLPVPYAGLRGDGERDLYRSLGAQGSIEVIGNPSVEIDFSRLPEVGGSPLFAVPAGPEALLEQLITVVESVVPGPLELAPHPRSDHAWLRRRCPRGWSVSQAASTFDRLAEGPGYVIQHTSGVAWESLALGVPTIDLNFAGASPSYPFIAAPAVLEASSTSTLGVAIERALERAADADARVALVEWAQRWCRETGPAAARAGAQLIGRAAQVQAPAAPGLDAWGAPGSHPG